MAGTIVPLVLVSRTQLALPARRAVLLVRIHAAREETTLAARRVAKDLGAAEKSRRSIITGLAIVKTTLLAAGVIWSFNATSRFGRGRRLFTLAISVLSTLRALREVSALLGVLSQPARPAQSAQFTQFTQFALSNQALQATQPPEIQRTP